MSKKLQIPRLDYANPDAAVALVQRLVKVPLRKGDAIKGKIQPFSFENIHVHDLEPVKENLRLGFHKKFGSITYQRGQFNTKTGEYGVAELFKLRIDEPSVYGEPITTKVTILHDSSTHPKWFKIGQVNHMWNQLKNRSIVGRIIRKDCWNPSELVDESFPLEALVKWSNIPKDARIEVPAKDCEAIARYLGARSGEEVGEYEARHNLHSYNVSDCLESRELIRERFQDNSFYQEIPTTFRSEPRFREIKPY